MRGLTTRNRRGRALPHPGRRWGAVLAWLGLVCLAGCRGPGATRVAVHFEDGGIGVGWEGEPGGEVALLDAERRVVAATPVPDAVRAVFLPLAWEPGADYVARVRPEGGPEGVAGARAPALAGPVRAWLLAPLGQSRLAMPAEAVIQAPRGGMVEIAVEIEAPRHTPLRVEVRLRADPRGGPPAPLVGFPILSHHPEGPPSGGRIRPGAAGLRAAARLPVPEGGRRDEVEVRVLSTDGGDQPLATFLGSLRTEGVPKEELAERVRVAGWRFPADGLGRSQPDRPDDTIHLPSDWWAGLARAVGGAVRSRDTWEPWGFDAPTLRNDGDAPVTVVVTERVVVAGTDREASGFVPPLREAATGEVSQLVTLPGRGETTLALPVFPGRGVEPGRYERELRLSALGLGEPLWVRRAPLRVHRGDPLLAGAFSTALALGVAGLGWLAVRQRRWLAERTTADLTTIALFGTALSVVGFATELVGAAASALLGPFQVLVIGLVQDLLRYTIVATLLLLSPRPGTAALAMLTGYGVQALAVGGLSPVGLLFLGAGALLQEGALWALGVTRGRWGHGETPFARQWLPLAAALTAASMATAFASLALHAVLYRLFFAPWYVVLVVAVPSGLYVAIAAAVGLRLGRGLRTVSP